MLSNFLTCCIPPRGFGVGVRSTRFALVVQAGKVSYLEVDEGMDTCENTSAARLVQVLTPEPEQVEQRELDPKLGILAAGALVVMATLFNFAPGGDDSSNAARRVAPPVTKATKAKAMPATNRAKDDLVPLLKEYVK
jgi:hypothetical protein